MTSPAVRQDAFTAAILSPDLPVPPGLSDPKGRPAEKRFDVYRNNVVVSLTSALETAFPVIAELLGKKFFSAMSGIYVRAHPAQSPLMMYYGEDMPAFLEGFEPVRKLGYLPDVARLELALRRAYHAADAAPLEAGALEATPPERLMACRPQLAPAVQILRSHWPLHAIWQFNTSDGAPKPQMGAEDVLITRAEFDPVVTLLPTGAAAFFSAFASGCTFADAVDVAMSESNEFDLAITLGIALQTGALTELRDPE